MIHNNIHNVRIIAGKLHIMSAHEEFYYAQQPIYKIEVDNSIFKQVIKLKNSSIRKLGSIEPPICNERTIRRSLKEGKMTPVILNQISEYLDVDPRLLSGELHKKAYACRDEFLKHALLSNLKPSKHPYFKKVQEEQRVKPIKELLISMFSLFEISYVQFEKLDFDKQFELQHDLFDSIIPVLEKYFTEDGYGQKGLPNLWRIIYELESYRDNYYERLYADTTLRKEFANAPPFRKTKKEILSTTVDDLIALDMAKQFEK